jgi:hypothetical protein
MRIKAVELSRLLDCSISKATKLITEMNEELKQQGYLTIRGSVPRGYAFKRLLIKEEQSCN